MKFINKLLVASIALCFAHNVLAQAPLITNITANGTYRLMSSPANIKQLKFYSTSPATVLFYDESTMTAPYYGTNTVLASYVSASSSITTNVSGPFIGSNGYTNYTTNIVLSTTYTTNSAATNEATKVYSAYIPPSTYVNVDTDIVLRKGFVVYALPATNLSVQVIYDNP